MKEITNKSQILKNFLKQLGYKSAYEAAKDFDCLQSSFANYKKSSPENFDIKDKMLIKYIELVDKLAN